MFQTKMFFLTSKFNIISYYSKMFFWVTSVYKLRTYVGLSLFVLADNVVYMRGHHTPHITYSTFYEKHERAHDPGRS